MNKTTSQTAIQISRSSERQSAMLLVSLYLLCTLLPTVVRAEVRLPTIFGDNMVLQAGAPVPVWGRASAGEHIRVECAGQHAETVAAADGSWRIDLPALEPGGPHTFTVRGTNTLTFTNVLTGEVWLCSGQSNMTHPVKKSDRAEEEIAAAKFPRLRLFTVKKAAVETGPEWDCRGQWVECSPETVGDFSGVAYFFGRELHQTLGRPVGLIHSSVPGTSAESWVPREVLAGDREFKVILDKRAKEVAGFPRAQAELAANEKELVARWQAEVVAANAAGHMPPHDPRVSLRTRMDPSASPCALYNGMIAPLAPFGLAGVIWYQGEGNGPRSREYRRLFPALIESWRELWKKPALPFLYVQLPNLARGSQPTVAWTELREAQLLTLTTPHTAMAVTIDVGERKNLHPPHKQPVGHRLALAAGALVYGRPATGAFSPVPREHRTDDGKILVKFDHAEDGLTTSDGAAPRGFVIAGEDKTFVSAEVRIEGDSVVAWSERVPKPMAVRYAWLDSPDCNLVNRAGLPASPFRTDDWSAELRPRSTKAKTAPAAEDEKN
jgi:sialate O-acetylesterase